MVLLEVIVLAVVQGIAEFLPISSSGHLVVVGALFGPLGFGGGQMLTVNIMLHLGTLLAILVFYRRRIGQLLGSDRRVVGLCLWARCPQLR